ncbi:hypothetical protein LMIY3S_02259 [Labrys miyagiensis]
MIRLPRLAGSPSFHTALRKRIVPALLSLAVAGGAHAQDTGPAREPGLVIGTTSSDEASGTSVLDNVDISSNGLSIHVAHITLKAVKRGNGQFAASDAEIEGATLNLAGSDHAAIEIPHASLHAITGFVPDEASLSAAGAPGRLPPIVDMLLAIKAGRIEIPEIRFKTDDRNAEYRDVVLTGLDSGKLDSVATGRITGLRDGRVQLALSRLLVTGADFRPYANWLDDIRAAKAAPGLKTVWDTFEIGDLHFVEPDGTSDVRKVTISGLKLAPPGGKPSEIAATLGQLGANPSYADGHPAEIVRLIRAVAPAFSLDSIMLEGLDIRSNEEQPVSAGLMRIESISASGVGEIRLGDLAGVSKDDNQPFTMGSVSLRGLNVGNLDKFLDAIEAGTPPKAISLADYPQLSAAGFALSDFSGETADQGPIRIEGFTLDAPQWTGLLPSRLSLHLKGLSGQARTLNDAGGRETFRKLGIDTIVINADADLAWNEADGTLAFGPTSAEIEQFAKLSVDGRLGNVPKSVFLDPAGSYAALLSADIRSLSLGLDERGSVRKMLDISAHENNVDVQQLPKGLAALASARMTGLLGAVNAEKISAALELFLADPARLRIDMNAKRPISLAPLVLGGADRLLDQIRNNVTVDARAD